MKLVSVRDLRSRSAEIWRQLEEEQEMVVTSNGRPVAVLSSVDEEVLEETLAAIRSARAVAALQELQRRSVEQGRDQMSQEEIEAEIRASRQARRAATE